MYHQLRVRLSLPFELEGEITKYNAIYLRNALTLDLDLKGSTPRVACGCRPFLFCFF